MELQQLRKELAAEAKAAGICQEWLEKIKAAPSREYLITLFVKGLDFGILHDFPSDRLAAEFDDIAPHYGIFVNRDGTWPATNKKRVIARDAVVTPATFDGFSVAEVYALHGSGVEVNASGYAIVAITVENGAQVLAKATDNAQVKIFHHGGQIKTSGNVKVINP